VSDLLTSSVLACPICRRPFTEAYVCEQGHRFAVVDDVPVLVPDLDDPAESISASFGREWAYFRHGNDRTWGETVEQRKRDFLRHIAAKAEDLAGKRVLDAGCGNGMLSAAISEYGCDTFACDLSPSVHHAARYFAQRSSVQFFRANLMQPPIAAGAFDIVFCAGVLHHTPSTRYTFDRVAETVAPGGRLFVWLYHALRGVKQRTRVRVRSHVARLPEPARHGVAVAFAAKKTMSPVRSERRMTWHEALVRTHDFWTPRYRHVHTVHELCSWFAEAGFVEATLTESGVEGFGMVAFRSAAS
jgi:SAM-dependent methyltransferase